MSEHVHGEMRIHDQEKTFAGFVKGGIILAEICIAVLVFLAIFNS